MTESYDLLIKSVKPVRPLQDGVADADIAVRDGEIVQVKPDIAADSAKQVVDGKGMLAFPGVVDAHMHTGIYSPLQEDAVTESRAAAMGGVTSSLNYMRTGQYYLNKGGPYAEFFPEVLALSADRFYVDYAYHLAPMSGEHIDEIELLIDKHGVTSFKIFMFYGSHGLHGRSDDQSDFLMIGKDEKYDIAHFEFIMRGIRRAMDRFPDIAGQISLSMHCETAEIMRAYTRITEQEGKLSGLAAYHACRPPHSEGLAIFIAAYLAHETDCANINLLHLSSRKAVEAAIKMGEAFPHIDFRREVTIGHLVLDINAKCGAHAKVNPPIRPREDVEYLWQQLLDKKLDWVVSDHACCKEEMKVNQKNPGDIFLAKSGFGGTEYLLPALITEGSRRGMSYNHIAEVSSYNPARRYGLNRKGDIAPGYDADVVLVAPDKSWVIKGADSESSQGYTPFEGIEMTANVEQTFLRGNLIYDGNIVGEAKGRYLARPY
ncbi:MAG: dihydroorotase [Gammaproteobacteria bacterium]